MNKVNTARKYVLFDLMSVCMEKLIDIADGNYELIELYSCVSRWCK